MPQPELSADARRALFFALVEAHDAGASVPYSRDPVAQKYGVPVELVRAVEREGLDGGWLDTM